MALPADPYSAGSSFEWHWPLHIEQLAKKLVWLCLSELPEQPEPDQDFAQRDSEKDSDRIAKYLCWLIAVHPESSPAILDVLSWQRSEALLERVAENPNTAADTLKRLALHPSERVRIAVAENDGTQFEVLNSLVNDENADVRYAIAENHRLHESLLHNLVEDENCYVSARAKQTLMRLNPGQPKNLVRTQDLPERLVS